MVSGSFMDGLLEGWCLKLFGFRVMKYESLIEFLTQNRFPNDEPSTLPKLTRKPI